MVDFRYSLASRASFLRKFLFRKSDLPNRWIRRPVQSAGIQIRNFADALEAKITNQKQQQKPYLIPLEQLNQVVLGLGKKLKL